MPANIIPQHAKMIHRNTLRFRRAHRDVKERVRKIIAHRHDLNRTLASRIIMKNSISRQTCCRETVEIL